MPAMMSACGVLCSECPAYHGNARGLAYRERIASDWLRIFGLKEDPANISCGGCCGPNADIFHGSRICAARNCCRSKGFDTCAECSVENCADLEKAQSQFDRIPDLSRTLSPQEFVSYGLPYCDCRLRLAGARRAKQTPTQA